MISSEDPILQDDIILEHNLTEDNMYVNKNLVVKEGFDISMTNGSSPLIFPCDFASQSDSGKRLNQL